MTSRRPSPSIYIYDQTASMAATYHIGKPFCYQNKPLTTGNVPSRELSNFLDLSYPERPPSLNPLQYPPPKYPLYLLKYL